MSDERVSLLEEIKKGGYEASLITTFNAYLPFYEDVVLRHLMSNGVRHNVLMMDDAQASLAIDRHPPRLAGKYYTLVPMHAAGAFHPKLIFLVGKSKGTLFIGSHNLTLSGFGYNRELTNMIRMKGREDAEGISILSAAWRLVFDWIEAQSKLLPPHIIEMITKIRDFAEWLQMEPRNISEQCRVLGSKSGEVSLWDLLRGIITPGRAKRVIVSGAFFDAKLAFIKRVLDDLAPDELIVGIDPESVQFPADAHCPGAVFVNCTELGLPEKNAKQKNYLHAKSLVIEMPGGEVLLAVGSANPSSPAWLAPGLSDNIEMVLVRKGEEAKKAARELGLLDLPSCEPVSDHGWQTVRHNWQRSSDSSQGAPVRVCIALSTDHGISFIAPQSVELPASISCEILTEKGKSEIADAFLNGAEYVIPTDEQVRQEASLIRFSLNDNSVIGIVQHIRRIEELSRSGPKRDLDKAINSLLTEVPNLDHFVKCIQRIITISDKIGAGAPARASLRRNSEDEALLRNKEGGALSISLEDVERKQPKYRLRKSDDLAYLLDVLLYSVKDDRASGLELALEERDEKGRSEEEQIGTDDENENASHPDDTPDDDKPKPRAEKGSLDVCHQKVRSLVNTACEQLASLSKGDLPFERLIVVMTGILAALRLLRTCDGKVPWIGAGQTALPRKELFRLFSNIAEHLFDGAYSMVYLSAEHQGLADADELARLKGLVLWLAWENGIAVQQKKPFNESVEERDARLRANRLMISLAQLVAGDTVVVEEARQSIGPLSSSDSDWLERVLMIDGLLRKMQSSPESLVPGTQAKLGDFGVDIMRPFLGVRQVVWRDFNKPALGHLSYKEGHISILADNLRIIPSEFLLQK